MSLLLTIFLLLFLMVLAYQDWQDRAVSWWLFIPVLFLIIFLTLQEVTYEILLLNSGLNLGYLIFQMGVIWLYFFLKNQKKPNILNNYFGLGDLVLLLVFACSFSFINYVLFMMIGMLFSIVLHLVLSLFVKLKNNSVPLVTYFSFFYLLLWSIQKSDIFGSSLYFLFLNN